MRFATTLIATTITIHRHRRRRRRHRRRLRHHRRCQARGGKKAGAKTLKAGTKATKAELIEVFGTPDVEACVQIVALDFVRKMARDRARTLARTVRTVTAAPVCDSSMYDSSARPRPCTDSRTNGTHCHSILDHSFYVTVLGGLF